jgi:hypothetical protein
MRTHCIIGAALAAITSMATADLSLDIAASAGSGAYTSYAVIDFGATAGSSYAFAYSWSEDASVHDMLLALQDVGLTYAWTDWGTGYFTDNFAYAGDAGEPTFYWAHSLGTIAGDDAGWSDAWSSVDMTPLSDGMISGWYNGFNDDYSAIPPSLPLSDVPGPATVILLGMAVVGSRHRRR